MIWTLINSYGGNQSIPRVYLIDKSGKIIYDRKEATNDTRLLKLKEILSDIFLKLNGEKITSL